MEISLLCNEVWLMSPNNAQQHHRASARFTTSVVLTAKRDCEEAIAIFLCKETRYLPQSSYFKLVGTDDFIGNARFKAVSWIIKSQRRMDLYPETVFAAVNYLDRFISFGRCREWKYWMFELLSITCLSIAAKFNEIKAYPLHEFQKDLESSFAPVLIQRMELRVLKALDWRVDSITPFSYIHLLIQTSNYDSCNKTELTRRVTDLLLHALLDPEFLEFNQFILTISAVKAAIQDSFASPMDRAWLAHLETLVPHHQKDDLIRCMERLEQNGKILMFGSCCGSPSSPVTVLDLFGCYEFRGADVAVNMGCYEFRGADVAVNMDLRWSKKREEEGEVGERV